MTVFKQDCFQTRRPWTLFYQP